VIFQSLDTVKSRLIDAIERRRRWQPPSDDEVELLERAMLAIEDLEDGASECVCRCM
jgi:hypothetical protein